MAQHTEKGLDLSPSVSEAIQILQAGPKPAGIYAHIPFCRHKCPYCHFYSVTDDRLQGAFVDGLVAEIEQKRGCLTAADTLYVGGGTPSVLPVDSIERILGAVQRCHPLAGDGEITIEVNPASATSDQLRAYRQMGFNRVNIGVQSFTPRMLEHLGRRHSAADGRRAVDAARRAGFDRIGLDLIFGIPGQTAGDWQADLEAAAARRPAHLSCYQLTFEPHTPLKRALDQGRVRPLTEQAVIDLYHLTIDHLTAGGYHQYEVSNYARSSAERSRHNRKYWDFSAYLGLGPAAHSFLPPARMWNDADVTAYIRALQAGLPPPGGRETLTASQLQTEAVYLGLRQADGIDVRRFEKAFGLSFLNRYGRLLANMQAGGLVVADAGRCALTRKGLLLLDTVAAELVCWEPPNAGPGPPSPEATAASTAVV